MTFQRPDRAPALGILVTFWNVLDVGRTQRALLVGEEGHVVHSPRQPLGPPGEGGVADSAHLTEGQVAGICVSSSPSSVHKPLLKIPRTPKLCSPCWMWKDTAVGGHPVSGLGPFSDPGQGLPTCQGCHSSGHGVPPRCFLLNGATTCTWNPSCRQVGGRGEGLAGAALAVGRQGPVLPGSLSLRTDDGACGGQGEIWGRGGTWEGT